MPKQVTVSLSLQQAAAAFTALQIYDRMLSSLVGPLAKNEDVITRERCATGDALTEFYRVLIDFLDETDKLIRKAGWVDPTCAAQLKEDKKNAG